MKNEKLFKAIFIAALIIIGGWITQYYWSVETIEEIKKVPILIMVLCMVYVVIQILKRYLFKKQNWWDWLYYIGLLSVMIPAYMATPENLSTFSMMTDYGIVFLIVPALLDGIDILKKK